VLKTFITKFEAVDAFATRAVPLGEVATLGHKFGNHTMKGRSFEVQRLVREGRNTFFACAQGAKVVGGARARVGEKLHLNATHWARTDRNIEETYGVLVLPAHPDAALLLGLLIMRRTDVQDERASCLRCAASCALAACRVDGHTSRLAAGVL